MRFSSGFRKAFTWCSGVLKLFALHRWSRVACRTGKPVARSCAWARPRWHPCPWGSACQWWWESIRHGVVCASRPCAARTCPASSSSPAPTGAAVAPWSRRPPPCTTLPLEEWQSSPPSAAATPPGNPGSTRSAGTCLAPANTTSRSRTGVVVACRAAPCRSSSLCRALGAQQSVCLWADLYIRGKCKTQSKTFENLLKRIDHAKNDF